MARGADGTDGKLTLSDLFQEIEVVGKRMGWKFLWVSSFKSEFNYDFNVSFRPEDVAAGRAQYNFRQAPDWTREIQDLSRGSVFYKNEAGEIYHTYSAYGRGGEEVLGIHGILDAMPKGRSETTVSLGRSFSIGAVHWPPPLSRRPESSETL